MKQDLIELAFILDRSGSMRGLEKETIGGYNSLLEKQKKEKGSATVTTVLFDNEYELLHDRIPLQGVAPITEKEYYVRGTTALVDAVGLTIQKIDNAVSRTAESERPEKVLVVITTDGMENASREYTADKVRETIKEKKAEGWEFLFLGANMDAVKTGAAFGIGADRSVTFQSDSEGTALNYNVLSEAVSAMRAGAPLAASWKKDIEEDVKKRKKR